MAKLTVPIVINGAELVLKVLENFEIDYKDNGKIIYLEKELLAIKKVSKPNDLVSVDIALKKLLRKEYE